MRKWGELYSVLSFFKHLRLKKHWHNLLVLDFVDRLFFDEAICFRSWLYFHLQARKVSTSQSHTSKIDNGWCPKKYYVSELYTIVKALLILFKSSGFPACSFYVKEPQHFLVGGSTFTKGNMLQITLETWSPEELCSLIQFLLAKHVLPPLKFTLW